MYATFNRFESPHIVQFGIPCKNLSMKEGVNRFSNFKDLHKWHDVTIRQP